MIKLLIGGSPCTHWSIAQKNGRETTPEGLGWELFRNYLIAKEKFKPDFFLYENNKSASEAIKSQIRTELGVWDGTFFTEDTGARYIEINSALVSAQNRQRFYVHNCGEVEQPDDRGILLRDILEGGCVDRQKAHCLKHQAENARDYFKKSHTQIAFEPVRIPEYGNEEKARPLNAYYQNNCGGFEHRMFSPNPNKQQVDMIAEPICLNSKSGRGGVEGLQPSLQDRIYSADGKAVTQGANGGGMGGRTGLYAVPVQECAMFALPHGWNEGMFTYEKSQTITTGSSTRQQNVLIQDANSGMGIIEGKKPMAFINQLYEVKEGLITIKGKQYPIKLPDGFYIIRKLTVTECCRLQTMPDDYCRAVSATQAYKGLGNGWTAEVIIHILSKALENVPRDEEIVVLSMYDGIGTGRYSLDKMGFTNVRYYAYEIDKYAMQISASNYPDIIQMGDAFDVRNSDWTIGY